jgi:hypothetical protein
MSIYCLCKKCETITCHRIDGSRPRGLVYCEVCGTERWYYKAFGAGDFPELTQDENEVIHEARACGFGSSFPAFPDSESQARYTLVAARRWLETHSVDA